MYNEVSERGGTPEEELGKKLFKRTNYSIQLTAEGMLFRECAEDILDMVHKTQLEFAAMDDEIAGDIYIGGAESAAFQHIAKAAKALKETHPGIRYHIYSGNCEDLDYRLEKGLLDFAFTLQSVNREEYNFLKIPDGDTWGVIMRRDHPLSKKKRIRLSDLQGQPLICSREAMREEYPAWFGEELSGINIVATFNLFYNASLMVREGLGIAVCIDRLAQTGEDDELCFRPLSPKLFSPLNLVWKKYQHLSPAAELFLRKIMFFASQFFFRSLPKHVHKKMTHSIPPCAIYLICS